MANVDRPLNQILSNKMLDVATVSPHKIRRMELIGCMMGKGDGNRNGAGVPGLTDNQRLHVHRKLVPAEDLSRS
jgi:hypothetical protein